MAMYLLRRSCISLSRSASVAPSVVVVYSHHRASLTTSSSFSLSPASSSSSITPSESLSRSASVSPSVAAVYSHHRASLTTSSSFSLSPTSSSSSITPSVSTVLQRGILARRFSKRQYREGDEITEDTVLFEGCDYNHWLITMDFPKDSSPEDMISTYEKTCAAGLGISLEEAKLKIYACSTTTYKGFQVVMTEEESEKFKGLPDAYIDDVTKEYGGDKYENGVITHKPPPVPIQYNKRNPLLGLQPPKYYDKSD